MINGVVEIVAAVLFAVVFLIQDRGIIWLWIAGVYLVIGIGNLVIYAIKNRSQIRAARKQAAKSAKEAEKSAKEAVESVKAAQQLESRAVQSLDAAEVEEISTGA